MLAIGIPVRGAAIASDQRCEAPLIRPLHLPCGEYAL